MLVITRRFGEAIVIGNDIRVTIISGREGQVRLGIDAPAELAVDRSEVRADKLANPRAGSDRHAAV